MFDDARSVLNLNKKCSFLTLMWSIESITLDQQSMYILSLNQAQKILNIIKALVPK